MKSIDNLVNTFTEADFIPDPYGRTKNGAPLSVLRDVGLIHSKLRELDIPFDWEPVVAGPAPGGGYYYFGKLTLTINGVAHTRAGSADTPQGTKIGPAGVEALALQNAALRGFGMGEWLYVNDKTVDAKAPTQTTGLMTTPTITPQVINTTPVSAFVPQQGSFTPPPQPVVAQTATTQTSPKTNRFGSRAPAGNGSFTPQTPKKEFGPWDGTAIVKSGTFAGKPWSQVPIEHLQKLNSYKDPAEVVKAELNRRMATAGTPSLDVNDNY